jgi:hypothetical protein
MRENFPLTLELKAKSTERLGVEVTEPGLSEVVCKDDLRPAKQWIFE